MLLFQDIIRDRWYGDSNISIHHAKSYRQVPHSLEWKLSQIFRGTPIEGRSVATNLSMASGTWPHTVFNQLAIK